MFQVKNSIGFLLGQASKKTSSRFMQLMKENNIDFGHAGWIVLIRLWEEDGLSQQEISIRSGVAKPNISAYSDQLEKDNYIVRTQDSSDRRNYKLFLTSKGKSYKDICIKLAEQANEETLQSLSDNQKDELIKLLKKII
jgi:DNA-binding MarR family transcriptional regulator